MDCPRCGASLRTFRLSGSESVVCESCSYVGVSTDLRPESGTRPESWEEALDRFRSSKNVTERAENLPSADDRSESDDEHMNDRLE
ncbi:zf-TFIIB domain-containing protein [Halobaculum sp. EA56]|uniref:TFIIB-type zinc ribbon-containing protein n=1 Tax=Halobaculum sp. EA56 TaxID=3421648 RepID=UPI003EC0747D